MVLCLFLLMLADVSNFMDVERSVRVVTALLRSAHNAKWFGLFEGEHIGSEEDHNKVTIPLPTLILGLNVWVNSGNNFTFFRGL